MEDIRLQKYISDCGIMSRRAAEREIEAGSITVNGEPAYIGQKIDPARDEVRYKNRVIKKARGSRYVYIMLNKPTGYVTTMSDDKGRKCVAELVADAGVRVYPVGRLDMDSEGLLLMTNDGELANTLTHPRHEIPKYYTVKLNCEITNEQLEKLRAPMTIDDYEIQPVRCEIMLRKNGYTQLAMELYEGRNRQIRKMCEQVGAEVLKLRRVAIGHLELEGLSIGKWRYLDHDEVEYLKDPKAYLAKFRRGNKNVKNKAH